MAHDAMTNSGALVPAEGLRGIVADWSSDQRAFKKVPWGNPMGAAQFGSSFFMITGFHGFHVSVGVIFLIITAVKVWRGHLDDERPGFLTGRKGNYEMVEIMGLYWHFVDLVWVFIFAFFYLW